MKFSIQEKKKRTTLPKKKPVAYTAEGKPIYGYNAKGTPVCYKIKKGGIHCMSVATMQNGRCKTHGGKSPVGPQASRYIDGTYSKYKTFPNGVADRVKELVSNPKLISVAEDIAYYDVRISEIGEELAGLDKASTRQLISVCEKLKAALEKDSIKKTKRYAEQLLAIASDCVEKYNKHQELMVTHEMRRKLSETEATITQKQDIQIPASRAIAIFERQTEITIEEVERWVDDPATRKALLLAISARQEKLLPGVAPADQKELTP